MSTDERFYAARAKSTDNTEHFSKSDPAKS